MTVLRKLILAIGGLACAWVLGLSGSALQARDTHPVDQWLSQHPLVADNVTWEFPPPVPYSKPTVAASARWIGRTVPSRIEPVAPLVPKFNRVPKQVVVPDFPLDIKPSGPQVSDQGGDVRAWPAWHEFHRQQLRDRFDAYVPLVTTACSLYDVYAASNFTLKPAGFDEAFSSLVDIDPVPVLDPPVNLQPDDPLVAGAPWTMIDSHQAFELYVRLVASQLVMEIDGCLPWSVDDYTGAELGLLFDGRTSFRYASAGPSAWGTMTATGHLSVGNVIPAPPMMVLGFLGQEGIIAPTRLESVERFLEWERTHLGHVYGGAPDPPLPSGELYWGYNGRAPVSRMLEARVMAAPIKFSNGVVHFDPEARHWVGGCGGASGFNAEILRVLNIPVERTVYGHQQNRFSVGVNHRVSTAHADDPYGMILAPEVPIGAILMDEPTFDAWFVNESDPVELDKNVSRWTRDLWITYLPMTLLKRHCADLANNKDHASGSVMNMFKSVYTVADLEAKGLWEAIEAKLAGIGGCAALGFGSGAPGSR